MTPEKYKELSTKAGLTCSCLFIVEIFIVFAMEAFSLFKSTWLAIVGGLCCLAAIIAAFVCVITAILGRKKSN
jgi:hypothetical protein